MKDYYGIQKNKTNTKRIILIFICIQLVLVFGAVIYFTSRLTTDTAYSGIIFNGEDIGGMSRKEFTDKINKYNEELEKYNIHITDNNGQTTLASINLKEISVRYNADEITNDVFKEGREGSVIERLKKISKISKDKIYVSMFEPQPESDIYITPQYDEEKLNYKITDLKAAMSNSVKDHVVYKDDESRTLKIIAGQRGLTVNENKLKEVLINEIGKIALLMGGANNTVMSVDIKEVSNETDPAPMDIDAIYEKYNTKEKNAKYEREGDRIVVIPEVRGERIDPADLAYVQRLIESAGSDAEGKVYDIPIKYVTPATSAGSLPTPRYNDVICEFSTSFTKSTSNRKTNIKKATDAINGKILLPGEEFSFNRDVGNTTQELGYLPAPGMLAGERVETYGGGVCQVSTTLYNACIKGGLDITKRFAHSETVSYANKGMDAAVAFDAGKDLAFKNNLDYPIKIEGKISGDTVTFKILGINKNGNVKYEFEVELVDSYSNNDKNYEKYTTYRTVKEGSTIKENKKAFNSSTYYIP